MKSDGNDSFKSDALGTIEPIKLPQYADGAIVGKSNVLSIPIIGDATVWNGVLLIIKTVFIVPSRTPAVFGLNTTFFSSYSKRLLE
jgi:hypothetical protein